MNSQTHMILGALVFGKPAPKLAWAGAAGGLLPDLPMYLIIAGLRIQGYSFDKIFGDFYWHPAWQIANALGHNFLIWGTLAAVTGWMLIKAGFKNSYASGSSVAVWFAFSGSALIHSLIDFGLHRNDAHMHFWPLSEWRFISPVSYWDPAYYGYYFSALEAALGLLMAILLFRRYKNILVRIALGIAVVAYIAIPLHHLNSAYSP